MIRGSFSAFVHCARNGHGVQSFRAKRASKAMPFCGYVLGSQEMLCWPAGQVTTCRSQSTTKLPLSKPAPARACQLGSSATGPTEGHAVLPLARNEHVGVGVALVDQVLTRQQVALLQRLMHIFDHVVVRGRGRRGL